MKRKFTTLISLTAVLLVGCNSAPEAQDADSSEDEAATLTVMAAASLQKSFDEIGKEFTAEHPDIGVDFNYAGSSTLIQNLEAGAPADIFASADEANMDKAEQSELIDPDTRELFAANTLVGIVPSDNPAGISSLEDANADDVNLVVCAPQVPCGALAQTLADTAGIKLNPASEEQQVSDVLGKVRSGQADAGVVYATDAALAPDEVETFEIDGAQDQLNHYPIATTRDSTNAEAADAFIAYVQSEAGQAILEEHGFTTP